MSWENGIPLFTREEVKEDFMAFITWNKKVWVLKVDDMEFVNLENHSQLDTFLLSGGVPNAWAITKWGPTHHALIKASLTKKDTNWIIKECLERWGEEI